MKIDIPYYIRQVLREQRMVNVPGIGTFRLQQSSASFNDDKTVISPPSLDITFDDSDTDDDSLLKYIVDTGLVSEAKALKKIEQYTQNAFNKLLNIDTFIVEGVGTLVKRVGQDSVGFDADVSSLTREFKDLSPLDISPITRISEQSPVGAIPGNITNEEDIGSFWPRILLISMLLIAAYFIGKHFYDSNKNQPTTEQTEFVGDSPNDEIIEEAKSKDDGLEEKYEEIDELIDPINEEELKGSTIDAVGGKVIDVELQDELDSPLNDVAKTKTDSPKSNEVEDTKENTASEKAIPSKPANKYANIIPASGECIIIVGAFMKSLNTIKMVSLLERKGYTVYQSEHNGYTRVGIKYECEDEDLESYLQGVRKNVSKKAWYLDPDLEVPYPKN